MAERTRFELVVEFYPYGGLANRWFQPLTHLSAGPAMLAGKARRFNDAAFTLHWR
jgi:hypothetical protein